MNQQDNYIKAKVQLLRPAYKRAFVNRIEFCDAAKNSGILLYVRKGKLSSKGYKKDLLDQEILKWIASEYQNSRMIPQHIDCDIEIEEFIGLTSKLRKYSFPIQIRYTSGNHEKDAYYGTEIEVYCYERDLKCPSVGITINTEDEEAFEKIKSTYMKFSEYIELLNKENN